MYTLLCTSNIVRNILETTVYPVYNVERFITCTLQAHLKDALKIITKVKRFLYSLMIYKILIGTNSTIVTYTLHAIIKNPVGINTIYN